MQGLGAILSGGSRIFNRPEIRRLGGFRSCEVVMIHPDLFESFRIHLFGESELREWGKGTALDLGVQVGAPTNVSPACFG